MALNINLGCGKRHIPGFVHVDLDDYPHIDYKHSVDRLPMFDDQSADLIYASHTLEYFDQVEVINVLNDWRRILKPGGILRVGVPDFAALASVYQTHKDPGMVIGPLYGRIKINAPDGERHLFHKMVYDFDSLRVTLEGCGFSDVQRYEWRETIHKDHDDFTQAYIPHMEKETGTLISLNVEARRI